jgi:DNA-binding XRE family transcriptional regulator
MSNFEAYKNLRTERKALKVSQDALAHEAGLNRLTIINIEKGKSVPKISTWIEIEGAFARLRERRATQAQNGVSHERPF